MHSKLYFFTFSRKHRDCPPECKYSPILSFRISGLKCLTSIFTKLRIFQNRLGTVASLLSVGLMCEKRIPSVVWENKLPMLWYWFSAVGSASERESVANIIAFSNRRVAGACGCLVTLIAHSDDDYESDNVIIFQELFLLKAIFVVYVNGHYTVCLKKTSPTFLAITRESIVGFS